jgi:hypothetical protein
MLQLSVMKKQTKSQYIEIFLGEYLFTKYPLKELRIRDLNCSKSNKPPKTEASPNKSSEYFPQTIKEILLPIEVTNTESR